MAIDDELAEFRRLMGEARDGQEIDGAYKQFLQSIRPRYRRLDSEDTAWLLNHLSIHDSDSGCKEFIAIVLEHVQRLPDSFFEALIVAAIYESNPSMNRYFVEPAVRDFGFPRVVERLFQFLDDGSNFEKSGAISAFYWARVAASDHTQSYATLRQQIRDKCLTEFVTNESTQVRRCIIPSLSMDPLAYSTDVRGLLDVAIQIARTHPDDYIRHRIEVQMGNETLLQPLPDRTE